MQFCTEVTARLEDYVATCLGGDGQALGGLLELECDSLPDDVAMGRRAFDGRFAVECIKALKTQTCQADGMDACQSALMGAVSTGPECRQGDGCGSGLFCKVPRLGCQGSCEARIELAQVCSPRAGDVCVERAFCEHDGIGDGVCTTKRVAGDPCDAQSKCSFARCGADGLCGAPALLGDTCGRVDGQYVSCLQGYCRLGARRMPTVCTAHKADGAACRRDGECATGACNRRRCGSASCQ